MVARRPEPVPSLVSVTVSGRLHADDFRNLRAWIDDALANYGKCAVLILFDQFQGWGVRALWDDFKFHTSQSHDVERIAYVGNKRWHRLLVNSSKPVTRTKIRYFDSDSLEAAKTWVLGA